MKITTACRTATLPIWQTLILGLFGFNMYTKRTWRDKRLGTLAQLHTTQYNDCMVYRQDVQLLFQITFRHLGPILM